MFGDVDPEDALDVSDPLLDQLQVLELTAESLALEVSAPFDRVRAVARLAGAERLLGRLQRARVDQRRTDAVALRLEALTLVIGP